MLTALLTAMEEELTPFLEGLQIAKEYTLAGSHIIEGLLEGQPVLVAASHIGKVSAALTCQLLLDRYPVTRVVLSGVAGSLAPDLEPGDLVIASEVLQHDVTAPGRDYTIGTSHNYASRVYPCDEGLVAVARHAAARVPGSKWRCGRVLTGDRPVKRAQERDRLHSTLAGLAVDMEGAAVGQVCGLNALPFLVVRSICDRADENMMVDAKQNFLLAKETMARFHQAFWPLLPQKVVV